MAKKLTGPKQDALAGGMFYTGPVIRASTEPTKTKTDYANLTAYSIIEKQLNKQYTAYIAGHQPTAIIMHPDLWHRVAKEFLTIAGSSPMPINKKIKQPMYKGLAVFRSIDIDINEIKIL